MHDTAPVPLCCAPTIALVQALGGVHVCPDCGERYEAMRDGERDGERDACSVTGLRDVERDAHTVTDDGVTAAVDDTGVHRSLRPRVDLEAQLAELLADLELARRWRVLDRAQTGAGPRVVRSSLAGWQGQGSGLEEDATDRQVSHLWDLVTTPSSKVGRRAREGFVEALVEHCRDTSRPDDGDIDWTRARALALTLDAMGDTPEGTSLRALSARCTVRSAWAECAGVVAEALAPPTLLRAWAHPAGVGGGPGRPRANRLTVPVEVDRVAWGGVQLTAAIRAWARRKIDGA